MVVGNNLSSKTCRLQGRALGLNELFECELMGPISVIVTSIYIGWKGYDP